MGIVMDEIIKLNEEKNKLHEVISKIDQYELKIFVNTDGRMVTNEFKESMKSLYDALIN